MTVIVPEINTRTSVEKIVSPPANGIITNGFQEWKDDETPENDTLANVPQRLDEETTFTATIKNTSDSISMVFSKNKTPNKKEAIMANGSVIPGSGVKVVSRGRRRSVDKQYKPTQPTNSGGSRGSTRRSGRYQNYDNNSSNGNSGADGNGEDNDDSDDDDDDEYIDEDDDDEEEEEEEEEEDEEEDDNKNEEEEEDESSSGREKSTNSFDGINEQLLSSLSIKGSDDSSVDMVNSGSSETTLAPAPAGTPVNLQGVICHETMGGVLVVNIKWRNKIYCGSLMDCTRHSWARPRFQSSDGNNQGKTRLGKNNGRGKGKGRGKRLRSNSVTRDNVNNHTVNPLKQKLRGRKKTISGSSTDKRTGFRSSKRKAKNNDDDSDDSLRPGKRSCTMKGAPSPQPSPTLIECPEPGCEKKYKHINGLRYHQAHAHLESKNQDDDANSDDRSSTTPSPSDEFKEPDPRTTTKARTSFRNRSESPSLTTQDKNNTNTDKDASNTEDNKKPKNEPIKNEDEPAKLWDAESEKKPDNDNEVVDEKQKEETKKEENIDDKTTTLDENKSPEENSEVCVVKTEETTMEGEFVEVADKSTDTRMINSAESKKLTSYPCEKHSGITIEMVLPASEVPEVADTQEVCVTVLDSGCISSTKYEDSGSVNIDDVISSQSEAMDDSIKVETAERQDVAKETEVGSAFDSKDDRRQIMLSTSSINQLGIEVEDISENEEDIDPGQDTEFNSREEMEKAVENLQTGSFVASMSTENNLQMLSSLKDPSLMFGLTNRDKTSEEGTAIDNSRTDDMFSVISRNKQLNNDDANQTSENSIDSELEIATRPLLGVSGENRDDSKSSVFAPSLSAKSESEALEKSVGNSPSSMSVENLVSRSISASKLQPPLTNTDTPSSRFKYFTCRSYGDEAYSQTASNITNTNTTTTLALIRDPDLIKQDNVSGNSANNIEQHAAAMNAHKNPVLSLVENVGPSYTGSAGFDRECTTSSVHTRGPKQEHKVENSTGDIVRSTSYGSPRRYESSCKVSFSSPKSSIVTTATTYNLQQYIPKCEESSNIKKDNSEDSCNDDSRVNLEKENSNQSNEGDAFSAHSEGTGDEGKKDGDREKASSRMFPRQPPTLIPKHSRPTPPTLPVGVAHPYQYSTVATTAAVTTGLSVTSPGRPELCRPEPVRHITPSKPDTELETKPPTLKKVVTEKTHSIPVGEVGPVNVKRPAIHAGLPTVIPVGAPVLKNQASLHTSIRQGLKPPGQEERASTPGSLSSRLSGSPRPLPSSPRPLSTSPRPPLPKANTSETKSSTSKESLSSSSSSEKSAKDDGTDTDVVIVKTEHEPASDKVSSVEAEKMKDRKRSPYQPSKDQLTPEKLHMYHQIQQRQMYQADIEYAYLQSLANPWHLGMSPEQMKLLQHHQHQQHHYRMRAEEEARELQASKNPKDDTNKLRMEKGETSSSIERRTTSEGRTSEQAIRSTPPRPERRLITGISPPSEASRSSTSDGLNRGVPRLTQVEEPPEKKIRAEYSKNDDTERELQKLRHKRQEEYLSKQSMQHKFTMFKQLESAGGAAKTHSIPPLTTTNKDRLGERDDDYPKSKYTQRSPHGESLQPRTQETSKVSNLTEANSSDASRSRDTNRDSTRDTHLKPISKHTWTSSSSSSLSRHSDTPPGERPSSSSFRPTQFQAYLHNNQMIEPINYDPATGNPVLMQTPMGLMLPQSSMELGGVMNLSSTSVITSSTSTPTSVHSRLKDRERLSPYRGTNTDQSPSSPHSRPSRSRSPSQGASPIPTSHSKSTYSRNNDRPRTPPSHVRSPYKTPDRTPSSSPSVAARSSYRSVSPSSHLHRSAERKSSSAIVVSRTSHRSGERSSSPSLHSHKESYRVPTSSPSRSSVFSRGERSASPPRSQAHNEYRFKQRSESSSNNISPESLSKAKTAHEEAGYRGQERHDIETAIQLRPGIISNNLAVRRGDVTPTMLMTTPAHEEELIRRHQQHQQHQQHQYMLYIRQQQEQAAYAMMSSNQQNASRSDPYYGKRQ